MEGRYFWTSKVLKIYFWPQAPFSGSSWKMCFPKDRTSSKREARCPRNKVYNRGTGWRQFWGWPRSLRTTDVWQTSEVQFRAGQRDPAVVFARNNNNKKSKSDGFPAVLESSSVRVEEWICDSYIANETIGLNEEIINSREDNIIEDRKWNCNTLYGSTLHYFYIKCKQ